MWSATRRRAAWTPPRRAPADGSTVLCCQSSNLTLSPHVRAASAGSDGSQFLAVASLYTSTFSFVVGTAVPAEVRTMQDYLRWVRDDPSRGSYGVPGFGTPPHVIGQSIARVADAPLRPLAYNGLPALVRELTQGGVPAALMQLHVGAGGAVDDGGIRALAVTSGRRWPAAPALPTLRELGLSDIEMGQSLGLHMPPGTPEDKVRELADAVQQVLAGDAMAAQWRGGLVRSEWTTRQAYAAALAEERASWKVVVGRERFSLQG